MGETIKTKFSPEDEVLWRRITGKVTMESTHKIDSINIVCRRKVIIAKGLLSLVHAGGLLIGSLLVKDKATKLKIFEEAKAVMKKAKTHKSKHETTTSIKYKISGESDLINESELSPKE